MHRARLALLAVPLLAAMACADTSTFIAGGDGGGPGDGAARPADASPDRGRCPADPCPTGLACYAGKCFPDRGPCKGHDDCQNDSFCEKGRCVPFDPGTRDRDPKCKGTGFTASALVRPKLKCSWTSQAVIMTPVVADLDGDKKPEIIFITFGFGAGGAGGTLVAIRGDTCAPVFTVAAGLGTRSQLAVGDLDGDKKPEIVAVRGSYRSGTIVVFDRTGRLLATAPRAANIPASFHDGGPALANLDGAGPPEIVYGGQALRFTGGKLVEIFNVTVGGGHWGILSAVADVDLDGTPEVVTGNRILDGLTGKDETPAAVRGFGGGYVAIAQFDKSTKEPEIVLISSQTRSPGVLRIYHPKTGKVVFGPYTFGGRWGGPPTVADFDGDGEPEVGAAGYQGYAVFDMECAKTPRPSFCAGPGVRWLKATRDRSSGSTGSSVFDFNGDGRAEVVYRDECWLRVYDGRTGAVRFAESITSGTILELPVIADVDGDGHADLVVPSHRLGGCAREPDTGLSPGPGTQGIFVLQDPKNRWMPSRAIWNQHTYHITNVNDDATIPKIEKNNWATWNNFRQNTQGLLKKDAPAPDLTGGKQGGIEATSDCKTRWVLAARICNRGTGKAGPGIPGTFYKGDPRKGGVKICGGKTTKALDPGKCEKVTCTWVNPPKGAIDLWFVADDDGTSTGKELECREKNNLMHDPRASCRKIG